jgi:hypothetical protein
MRKHSVRLIARLGAFCLLSAASALTQEPSAAHIFIQMLPRGMNPQQVTVAHGKIEILVENRSTAPNVTLDLDQAGGSRVSEVSLLPHQHHALQTFTLSPGTYVLSESHHKSWSCTITVQ